MNRRRPTGSFLRAAPFSLANAQRAIAAAILLAACACSLGCRGPVPELFPPKPRERAIPILVVSHGWHTGVALERDAIPRALAWPELDSLPESEWLEVGWGDEGFYRAERVSSGLAVRAIFWPTPSVLHVVAFDGPPTRFFAGSGIVRVDLSPAGYEALLRAIGDSFARTRQADGVDRAENLGPGLYGASRFFRARGSYWLFRTCNHWTARTIRAAGCPITPFYGFSAGNVMGQAEGFGERIAELAE
jgi:uncharacterized protein (TIGR02117 family)